MSCSTSPSAMTFVASAMMARTRWLPSAGHHLKGARVHEVPDQDAGLVAEDLIGGIATAAHRGAIDHIVMQQRGGVDELDEGRSFNVSVAVGVTGTAGQNHQQGPQALAAARDDVLGNAIDQGDRASSLALMTASTAVRSEWTMERISTRVMGARLCKTGAS